VFLRALHVLRIKHFRKKGLPKEWILLPLPPGGKTAGDARFSDFMFFRHRVVKRGNSLPLFLIAF
jgi:hypothetical protein